MKVFSNATFLAAKLALLPFAYWAAAWSDYAMEPEEFVDAGERVVAFVLQKTTGHGSGVVLERHDAMVFEVRDRKIVRIDYYNNRDQALKAVELAQ